MAFKFRKPKRLFSQYIKENVLIATSGDYQPEALVCAIGAMGADRILFAADYSWVSLEEAVELVERAPISDSDKEKVYHLNAER
jgi:2,3-dihydroxybenzoate decarboxylase